MRKYLVMATPDERFLPLAKANSNLDTIITGVGGVNVIQALRDLPRNSEILNVGYCGSASYPIGSVLWVCECRLWHPNVEYKEPIYTLDASLGVTCLTAGDFVLDGKGVPPQVIVDMELAFILAFGFSKVTSVKYVSDNFDLNEYSRTSSLSRPVDGNPAAGCGPALLTGAGRGEH